MWYKKDVLQGEVYPLSREERVYRFVYKCRRWRIGWLTPCSAAGSFNTLTLALPAVASVACNLLMRRFRFVLMVPLCHDPGYPQCLFAVLIPFAKDMNKRILKKVVAKMVGNDEQINSKSKVNLSLLPPCVDAHRPHVDRVNYLVANLKNHIFQFLNFLNHLMNKDGKSKGI